MADTMPREAAAVTAHSRWWVLLTVGIGTFMSALDGSVVNTILPVLSHAFSGGVADVEWVVTIYLLVVSGLLLGFGRLGDLIGYRPAYLTGFAVFVGGSAVCGAASTLGWLVACRALQAIGAAMLFANGPALLTTSFPGSQRGRALGLQATMTYLGLTAGPSLGGWLAQALGWRSVFYINVPIGVVGLALGLWAIPRTCPAEKRVAFDWWGAGAFLVGLSALLFALNQGHAWGWASGPIVASGAIALAALGVFFAVERRSPAPMVNLGLFRSRVFASAVSSALLNYIAVYGILFLLPFYLMQGRGLSPAQAGLVLTAQPIVMAVVAPISGAASDRIGTRGPAIVGMGVMAVGLYLLSRVTAVSPMHEVAIGLAVVGLGTGVFISPNNSALMGSAPREAQGVAGGILATARNVGMVLGTGVAGATFTTVLARDGAGVGAIAHATHVGFLALVAAALLGSVTSAIR